jgi:hypothetical protein
MSPDAVISHCSVGRTQLLRCPSLPKLCSLSTFHDPTIPPPTLPFFIYPSHIRNHLVLLLFFQAAGKCMLEPRAFGLGVQHLTTTLTCPKHVSELFYLRSLDSGQTINKQRHIYLSSPTIDSRRCLIPLPWHSTQMSTPYSYTTCNVHWYKGVHQRNF